MLNSLLKSVNYIGFFLTRAVDVFPGSPLLFQLLKDRLLSPEYTYKSNHIDYSFVHPEIQDILYSVTRCYDEETIEYDRKLLELKLVKLPIFLQINTSNKEIPLVITKHFKALNSINYLFFIRILENKGELDILLLDKLNLERKNQIKDIYNKLNLITTITEGDKSNAK